MRPTFHIRDLLWLTVLCAVGVIGCVTKADPPGVGMLVPQGEGDPDDPWYFGGTSGLDELPPLPPRKEKWAK